VGDKVSEQDRELVAVTYECLQKAIEIGKLISEAFLCQLF
jgi:hypothetical protein